MRALAAGRGLVVAIAGLALVAGIAACGDDDDDVGAGTTAAPATDTAADTEATETTGEVSTTTIAEATTTTGAPDDTTPDSAGAPATTTTTAAWVRPAGCEALPHDPVHTQVDAVPPLAPFALLTDLLLEELECGDRLAFTFAATPAMGGDLFVPGHDVEEATGPFTADPSGLPVTVAGDRFVVVRLFPASIVDTTADPPVQTYDGNLGVSPLGGPVVQVEQIGSFESVTSYVIGLHGDAGFTVETRPDPPQLLITFG